MRPILALDVDGPINVFGSQPGKLEWVIADTPVFVPPAIPARIHRLSQSFQVVWSTSWGRDASLHMAPRLGLPAGLPWLDFDLFPPARRGQSRKLPALQAFLKEQPAAIVDDEIGRDMRSWARRRKAPTLLVEVDPRRGLEEDQVEALLRFSATCLPW